MSHRDAPALTPEQRYFEAKVLKSLAVHEPGTIIGMGRDKRGEYLAIGMRERWSLWQAARVYCE